MEEKPEIPEWEVFKRIEELETEWYKQSYSLDDALFLAKLGFTCAIVALFVSAPNDIARAAIGNNTLNLIKLEKKASIEIKSFAADIIRSLMQTHFDK